LAENVKTTFPEIVNPVASTAISLPRLRALGLPESRARCCVTIAERSQEILSAIQTGGSWEAALANIKGIGPWTISVFRIMVLRDPDVLPLGDVGLERAVAAAYGPRARAADLEERWRPFRSVACWYLWRTLGNEQLG
jgi:DNA-3-methyladenine glycosylase II